MDWLRRFLGLQPADETEELSEGSSAATTTSVATATTTQKVGNAGAESETLPNPPDKSKLEQQNSTLSPAGAPTETKPKPPNDGRTRQLPPLEQMNLSGNVQLNFGHLSDVGQVRDNNQDSLLCFVSSVSISDIDPNFGLFVVADGMGGHEHGERASAIATRIITKHVTNDIFLPLLNGETGGDTDRPPILDVLRTAVQSANQIVAQEVPDGGTTVTAAALMGQAAYIAHVGDSRAYMIYEDMVEQITRDHSLVQRLIELDQLTPEDAVEHPQRNVLYRAIGQADNLDVDAIFRQVIPGSFILICSDGLWNLVSKEEMYDIVMEEQDNTQAACKRLVDIANDRGGSDNITVILVRVPA